MITIILPSGTAIKFEDTGERLSAHEMEPGTCFSFEGDLGVNQYLGNGIAADITDSWETFMIGNPREKLKIMADVE